MKFLYEKETRKFYLFLAAVCTLQICFLGFFSILEIQNIRQILVNKELTAASCLLENGVPPVLAAQALNAEKVTKEGIKLLKEIGHTGDAQWYLLLVAEQYIFPVILRLLLGVLPAAAILAGAGLFFNKRNHLYENVEKTITRYAENQFGNHLPTGETGAIYQLFGSIEQLAMSLQAKNEMEYKAKVFLKNMISNISHQLKTPLAALEMYMEIILGEPCNEETVRNFSWKSMQSLERMEQLIQALLKMARLETGNIVFEKRPCYASELAAQAVGDLQQRAKQEGKEILMEGDPGEILVCDQEWTREAVANLVKNALDHTDRGGIVRVSWKRSLAVFCLTVQDNGCGIAPEDIHHIFKQFYRSRKSSDQQGAGLGLSLAKSIVEGQGGSLAVESRVGAGSVFWINFAIS